MRCIHHMKYLFMYSYGVYANIWPSEELICPQCDSVSLAVCAYQRTCSYNLHGKLRANPSSRRWWIIMTIYQRRPACAFHGRTVHFCNHPTQIMNQYGALDSSGVLVVRTPKAMSKQTPEQAPKQGWWKPHAHTISANKRRVLSLCVAITLDCTPW